MYTVNQLFPLVKAYFEENYGSPSGIFLIHAGICVLAVVFIYFMVPETKGKSLEEIANALIRKSKGESDGRD